MKKDILTKNTFEFPDCMSEEPDSSQSDTIDAGSRAARLSVPGRNKPALHSRQLQNYANQDRANQDHARELAYFMRICSMREYCDSDIRRKCVLRGLGAEETEQVLETLHREKFLDETRYAEAFVRDKARISGWGAMKIASAMRGKALPEAVIKNALRQLDDDSVRDSIRERMLQVLAVKWRTLGKEQDPVMRKNKLLRYALGRGYSYEDVKDFLLESGK